MRRLGILLSLAMVLGVSGRAMAVSAIWSEEMDAAPNVLHAGRWSTPATAFSKDNGLLTATMSPQSGVVGSTDGKTWLSVGTGATSDLSMIVLDGPYRAVARGGLGGFPVTVAVGNGPANDTPSPMAGLKQYTFEARFRSSGPAPTGNGNWPIEFELVNVGNQPVMIRHGARIPGTNTTEFNQHHPLGPITPTSSPAFDISNTWHTIRITQDFTGDQLDGTPGDSVVKWYYDGSLQNTFTQVGGTEGGIGINRSLSIRKAVEAGANLTTTEYDYIRIANTVLDGTTPLDAVPEPATGILALAGGAIALLGRRRQA